ncbi:unnamed protein product [Pieris macdunnoughi]|uniref:GATA zinc finger domain-containing protein 14-like n=1 Tax=Pieris macdunnoughi TaxID=345717 RepID=A0A821S6S9_9NEOP|nr:unnamed protein product [Pieris macdunnoughi]
MIKYKVFFFLQLCLPHDLAGSVLGGLSHGINLNIEGHIGAHQQRRPDPGFHQKPHQNGYNPGPPGHYGRPNGNNYNQNNYERPNNIPNNNFGNQNHYGTSNTPEKVTTKQPYDQPVETTTKKLDNDEPFFVPLSPDEYNYGGQKINITEPKRETNKDKQKQIEDGVGNLDIRFKDD